MLNPQTNLVRLDKNIASEANKFTEQYSTDGVLMRDIMIYLCSISQENRTISQQSLFTNLIFDTTDFCKKFGYRRTHLQTLHPHPKHVEILQRMKRLTEYREKENTDFECHIFESVLENALYRLITEPFILPTSADYRIDNGNTIERASISTVPILISIRFNRFKTKSGQYKHFYECVFSPTFELMLYDKFSQLDIASVRRLRQPQADNLYIYLNSLKDTLLSQGIITTTLSLNYLLQKAEINIKTITDAKRKLITKFQALNQRSDINVLLTWGAAVDGRAKYTPTLTFQIDDVLSSSAAHKYRYEFWETEFYKILIEQINNRFPHHSILPKDNAMLRLFQYLKSSSCDVEIVQTALRKAHIAVFGNDANSTSARATNWFNMLATQIINARSTEEIHSIFTKQFVAK